MINTTYSTFYKTPEALDGVSMGTPDNIITSGMVTLDVVKSGIIKGIVDFVFVSIDKGSAFHILGDQRHNGRAFDVSDRFNTDLAVALCNTDHGNLVGTFGWPTLIISTSFAADIGLVNLDFIRKHTIAFIKKCTDLLEHTPSCLISYASSALKFFGRMTRSGSCHPKHSLKPSSKRGSRLMEDSSSGRINFMPAEIAFIARPFGYLIVLCNLRAGRAFNTIGKAIILEPFKASIVIGEFLVKVFHRVFGLFRLHFSTLLDVVYHINNVVSRDSYQP